MGAMTRRSWRRPLSRSALGGLFAWNLCVLGIGPTRAETEDDHLLRSIENGRSTRDEAQLRAAANELDRRTLREPAQPRDYYLLARAHRYLADVFESRKDRKAAAANLEQAIAAVTQSLALDETFSDAHSLLADLYGRKISLGGFLAGAKYGPKVGEETRRALDLEPKNPRAWASLGRQTLLAPKAFGGDVGKAIESFRRSLDLDPRSDETWIWLALAYEKLGDISKARESAQHALELNPRSISARELVAALAR